MPVIPEYPVLPTYSEFDRLIESVTGDRAPLTSRFVRGLFDRTRRHRMNGKLEALANAAIKEAVNDFADAYRACVKLEAPCERPSFSQVIESPKHRVIPSSALDVANEVVIERLIEFEQQSIGTIAEGLFVISNQELAIDQARRWLDYVEQTKESGIFIYFLALGRELTILCRTYDLLNGMILRQKVDWVG